MTSAPPEPVDTCPSCGGPQWHAFDEMQHGQNCVPCPACKDNPIPGLQHGNIRECRFCKGWKRVMLRRCNICQGEGSGYIRDPNDYRGSGFYTCRGCDGKGRVPTSYVGPPYSEHIEAKRRLDNATFE